MSLQIKDIPFFHDLTPIQLKDIQSCLIEKTYEKGETLHSEGNECTRLFFVKEGRVKIYRTSASGKEQIFEILGPGDTCACNPGNVEWFCSSSASAVETSKVWYLSRENYLKRVQENSVLMQALNKLFAERLQCFGNIIEEVSLKDTKKRLIKFLLDMLKDQKKGAADSNTLFIPFTREEISHRLGTARETVARHISELKRKKLIDVKPYKIIIRDQEGLKKLL